MENTPEEIVVKEHIFDLDFHPLRDIVAVGQIDGKVNLFEYSSVEDVENKAVLELSYHHEPCRCVLFSQDGNQLLTASSDKSLRAVDASGKVEWAEMKAHEHPVNSVQYLNKNMVASGDDSGCVKIWDTRLHKCVVEWTDCTDFVSDMTCTDNLQQLLVTSGDGTLAAYDLRKNKLDGRSDDLEDELLSVLVGKNGKKVFCGSQDGVICIFSSGMWADMSDRFPGHPQSIDTMLKIDEDTICTGSSDGLIRIVQLQPNRLLGVIGDHEDFPVEVLKSSRDKNLIGSISHANKVHFWDVGYLYDDEEDEDDTTMEVDSSDEECYNQGSTGRKKLPTARETFYSDL